MHHCIWQKETIIFKRENIKLLQHSEPERKIQNKKGKNFLLCKKLSKGMGRLRTRKHLKIVDQKTSNVLVSFTDISLQSANLHWRRTFDLLGNKTLLPQDNPGIKQSLALSDNPVNVQLFTSNINPTYTNCYVVNSNHFSYFMNILSYYKDQL